MKHIENWLPYVDYVIIVVDETVSNEEIFDALDKFRNPKLIIKRIPFPESIPEFRNQYVEKCKELGVKWFVVSDPDEWINEETRKDIRKIVEWAEKHGYTQLGLNCKEKFEPVEWLPFDQLDKLKEYPGGIRESTYYKFLINKICCERFKYEGVGKTKTVHETWGCPVHKQRGAYLPKDKYWYVHAKTAYDIWRNAARNLWLGGGGDNVGDLNEMWVELRKIVEEKLGITKWKDLEVYVVSGKPLPKELIDWVKKALTWKATDYGVETREFAKWVIFHHRYLLEDPEIKYGVEHPPKLTPEDEVETYVRRCYFQVLGRHPDRGGLEYYKKAILEGKIRREDLPRILMASPEYREKMALVTEKIRVNIPVDITVNLTEDVILQAIMKSRKWFTEVKPKYDLGKFILTSVSKPQELIRWFYLNKDTITLKDLLKKLEEVM